jgi:hypothetical protein
MHIHHFQIYDRIRAIALVIFLGCFLIVMPVQAQTSKESPITLDGRQLFTVSDTGQVSAENRSTDANLTKPRKQFQIKSDLFFKIDANLRHHNIQVPLPQRSLHIGSGSLPLELSSKLEDSLLQISTAVTNWFNKQAQSNDLKDYTNSSLNNKHKDF